MGCFFIFINCKINTFTVMEINNSKLDYVLNHIKPFVENVNYISQAELEEKVKDKIPDRNELIAILELLTYRNEIHQGGGIAIKPEGLHKLKSGGYSKVSENTWKWITRISLIITTTLTISAAIIKYIEWKHKEMPIAKESYQLDTIMEICPKVDSKKNDSIKIQKKILNLNN